MALAVAFVTTGLPATRVTLAAANPASQANVFRADSVDTTPTGGVPRGAFATADPGRELPERRTANSNTYEVSDGSNLTEISSGSVNYRHDGAWSPIDNTLVQSSSDAFALQNAANRYTLQLPQSLARPMAIELDAGRFELGIRGAAGALSASENSATYAEALPESTSPTARSTTRSKRRSCFTRASRSAASSTTSPSPRCSRAASPP